MDASTQPRSELVVCGLFAALGIAIFLGAYTFTEGGTYLSGPRAFPQGVGVIMTVAALIRIGLVLKESRRPASADVAASSEDTLTDGIPSVESLMRGAPDTEVESVTQDGAAADTKLEAEPDSDREQQTLVQRLVGILKSPGGLGGISLAYVLALGQLGFIVATVLYCWALSMLFHPRPKRAVLLTLVASGLLVAIAWLVFVYWLRAPLPRGVFG